MEGRIFGLEKGFEKYVRMGRLHGKAVVWAGRLPPRSLPQNEIRSADDHHSVHFTKTLGKKREVQQGDGAGDGDGETRTPAPLAISEGEEGQQAFSAGESLPLLSDNPRLEKHIRMLYALVEVSSLSTANTEEAVADFDDRLKRAEGKVKIIEKLIGEFGDGETIWWGHEEHQTGGKASQKTKSSGDGSIEDISSLRVRR